MRKSTLVILSAALVLLAAVICTAGCVTDDQSSADRPVAVCTNGIFVGTYEEKTGVASFKGIPYAKQPVGDLRWKAPQAPEASSESFDALVFGDNPIGIDDFELLTKGEIVKDASKFGHAALQIADPSEPAGKNPQGEDCLTLNIWTQNLEKPGKAVMVYFHGGGFASGGSSDPLYNGQNLAAKDEDIIIVTANYRISRMGFIDFSDVEGGEDFPDAPYLGLLDTIAALKWVQENIEAFGGDPKKVTIFGESAGSGLCGTLLSCEEANGLFKRAILESGDAALTSNWDDQKRMRAAEGLLKVTGSKNMDDLMALSKEDLLNALASDTGIPHEMAHPFKPNNCLENVDKDAERFLAAKNTYPLHGGSSPAPENPYQAIANGVSKDVDVLAGTNADEMRYFISTMNQKTDDENMKKYAIYIEELTEALSKNSAAAKKIVENFLKTVKVPQDKYSEQYPGIWEKTALLTDYLARLPEVKTIESQIAAGGEGKTYMYLFGRGNPEKPLYGAGHAVELPYVFCNVDTFVSGGGSVDPVLADKISSRWINFAKTGNPSIEGFEWTEYTLDNRATMVVGQDSSITMVNDPKSEQRIAIMPLLDEIYPVKA